MSKVSIHIVTFNSEEHIVDCLQAILAQTYPIEEVIVIDNASRDATCELLRSCEMKLQLVFNSTNAGFAVAHNQALLLSKSDYHLILNPDVVLHKDYVFHLLSYISKHPYVGCATGKLLFKSAPEIIDSTGLRMTKARRAYDLGTGQALDLWNEPKEVFGVSGAAALYSRSLVEDISIEKQFFDEDFFAYKEDVDVAWRSQLMGWSAVFIPDAVGYHERGWKAGKRSQQPIFIRKHSYINRYRMMFKNESIFYLMLHLPYYVFYEAASFVYIMVKEPLLLTAWFTFFKDLPSLCRKRRIILAKKTITYDKIYTFFL
jgi:GT2 family glycosyltransferase